MVVETVSSEDLVYVEACLGRAPRGLQAVSARDAQGRAASIRVAPLVDGKPFPTLFWLVDPELRLRIDREEAGGTIKTLQQQVDNDEALRSSMAEDHRAHIALRASYIDTETRQALEASGRWRALSDRGIGGIADFGRIRCLHTWYAAHLVHPNTIGRLLDDRWALDLAPGQVLEG
ncbi:MAG: DUF501 domain-containing protein [Pseudomonadota bacterium]